MEKYFDFINHFQENNNMAGHLAFWMANSSEFLHFLKQDMELSSMTEESQKILAHTTQQAFRSLVQCIKAELQGCLAAFLDPSDESDFEEGENESTLPEGGEEKFDPTEGYLSTERSFRVKNFGPHGRPLGGDQWLGKDFYAFLFYNNVNILLIVSKFEISMKF